MAGLFDFGQDVRRENHRVVARQSLDQLSHFVNLFRIETDGRFVENQNRRIVQQRLRDSDALLIAFGKLRDDPSLDIGDVHLLHHPVHFVLRPWRRATPLILATNRR